MFLLMPYFSDDFWYMSPMRSLMEGRETSVDWAAVGRSIRYHYLTDNGRLSNILFTLLICLPKWVLATLTSVLNALSLLMLARLAGLGPRRPAAAVWLCLLFSATLPWYDGIFSLCFQFNYVWAMALMLFALMLFLSGRRLSPVPLFFLGIIAGAWHEGFSVPLLSACVLLAFWRRGRFLSPGRIALMLGLLAGVGWLLSSPAFFRYDSNSVGLQALLDFAQWYRAIRINVFVLFALVLMAVALCLHSSRRILLRPVPVACAAMAAVGLLIYEYVPVFERASFCARLMAIPLLLILFRTIFHPRPHSARFYLSYLATLGAGVFLLVHLVIAIISTDRFRAGMERASGSDVFINFPWSADAGLMALGKPFLPFQESYLEIDERFRRMEGLPVLGFVPRELEYATPEGGIVFPGHPGLRLIGSRLVIPVDSAAIPDDPKGFVASVRFGDSSRRPRRIIPRRFTSHADSSDYYFLSIQELYPIARFLPPTAIDW